MRLDIATLVLSSLGSSLVSAFGSPSDLVVDLGYARYQGTRNDSLGIRTFYGIRYAEPPVGSLRWRAPVPIDKNRPYDRSRPLQNATIPSYQCVQTGPGWSFSGEGIADALINASSPLIEMMMNASILYGSAPRPTSEDCLSVDIITPLKPKISGLLPVVVEIHGGGYVTGNSGSTPMNQLVANSNGSLVVVAIQYRLGPYGYLSSKELRHNGDANVGMLDQRAAMEWVRRNVKAFGGDPEKVTIWGGSGGGGSVLNQLILYGGEKNPPFRAAIAEFPWMPPYRESDFLEAQYSDLLSAAGCKSLSCLRYLPAEKLANASQLAYISGYQKGLYGYGDTYFSPSVDGKTIRDLPSTEFERGHFARVPLITDSNRHEGIMFQNTSISTLADEVYNLKALFPRAPRSFVTNLLQRLYPLSKYSSTYLDENPVLKSIATSVPKLLGNSAFFAYEALFGDFIINCPARNAATGYSRAGLPVWKLRFNAGTQLHGASEFYAIGIGANKNLSRIMNSYYMSFISNLDPNAANAVTTPAWPKYLDCRTDASILDVYETDIDVVRDPYNSDMCDFFERNRDIIRQ